MQLPAAGSTTGSHCLLQPRYEAEIPKAAHVPDVPRIRAMPDAPVARITPKMWVLAAVRKEVERMIHELRR
jgi:hypothetical protein